MRKGEVAYVRSPVAEPGAGQLLVQAARTLISTGTELTCLSGRYEPGSHWDGWVKYPFQPGYCMAGAVVARGEGATRFLVGDRVATRGPHQGLAVVPEDQSIAIPSEVSDDDACWYGMATIAQNAVRRPNPSLGDTVAIIGLGLIGQLLVQYMRLLGARQIFAIDTALCLRRNWSSRGISECFEGGPSAWQAGSGGRLWLSEPTTSDRGSGHARNNCLWSPRWQRRVCRHPAHAVEQPCDGRALPRIPASGRYARPRSDHAPVPARASRAGLPDASGEPRVRRRRAIRMDTCMTTTDLHQMIQ